MCRIMLRDRIEYRWIENFAKAFALSKVGAGDAVAILSESQSRELNVHLAELALQHLGAKPFHVTAVTPAQSAPVPVRSTGASQALQGHAGVLAALKAVPVIVDVTKMPNPNDVTERDLMAVPVDDDNGQNLISDAYTINDEVDIMEDMGLDDEIEAAVDDDPMGTRIDDELAATQALSEEIEKAAAELASGSDPSGETSIEMQLTNLSDLDLTSELEAQNDDFDNDVTARLEADDKTIEMPAKDKNAS